MTVVRGVYGSECRLEGRIDAYPFATGPDARQRALDALAEAPPAQVLEVGCGTGDFTERIAREIDARALRPGGRLVAVTNSAREHLLELLELPPRTGGTFSAENGEELLPADFDRPSCVRRAPVVFVAER